MIKIFKWTKHNVFIWISTIAMIGVLLSIVLSSISYRQNTKLYYRIDFPNGRTYWSKYVKIIPGGIEFTNIETNRNIVIYGTYTMYPPKN